MFTGIVEELGVVDRVDQVAAGDAAALRLRVSGPLVATDANVGDSIAVSGVCLTVTAVGAGCFEADVMRETLVRSTLGRAAAGTPVNLERPVSLQSRLGGHLVQGHVDGTARLVTREHTPQWDVLTFEVPAGLGRYLVEKGSVALAGVSLTVVDAVDDGQHTLLTVSLIPTTLTRTTLGGLQLGDEVNVEVDIMAKYAERLLAARRPETIGGAG